MDDTRTCTKTEMKNNIKREDADKQLHRFRKKCLDFSFLEHKTPKEHRQTGNDPFQPLLNCNQAVGNENETGNVADTELRNGFNKSVHPFNAPSDSHTTDAGSSFQGI